MTPSERDIESYIATATAGFGEIAESLLGAPSARLPDGERLTAATRFTAFVPVLANEKTIYVGVGSSLAGAVVATRSFLGFEPTDDDPSVEDVADAVGELANMTAGVVQRELAEYGKSELGLPVTLAELGGLNSHRRRDRRRRIRHRPHHDGGPTPCLAPAGRRGRLRRRRRRRPRLSTLQRSR